MRRFVAAITVVLAVVLAAPFALAGMLVLIDADERYAAEDAEAGAGSKGTRD